MKTLSTKVFPDKIKVGMVQINNSFDRQNYFPLSLGFIHSYAQAHSKNFRDFEFLTPIYKRIALDTAAEQLSDADMVAFSTYVWNFEISKAIAKRVKQQNPNALILFGGPHVPEPLIIKGGYAQKEVNLNPHNHEETSNSGGHLKRDPDRYDMERDNGLANFLKQNDFIDYVITGEGEKPFAVFLDNYHNLKDNSERIYGMHFLKNGELVSSHPTVRVGDLNEIPSPYLNGYFNPLIEAHPEGWIGLFETNRGCPFKCSFCDWGTVDKNKIADYELQERIFPEIDWFSRNKIEFIYCCDANFGMFSSDKVGQRDLKIVEKFAGNKEKFGYPHRISVQNTKNSTDASYRIQKLLVESGLDKGVLLAFQSLNPPTLKAIDRANIKLDVYHELQRRFTKEGVTTLSDMILGLPLETYESWTNGISTLIENGQHNRIQFNNLSLLPNAPMVKRGDIGKYGLETVVSDMINIHGSLGEWVDNIHEKQQVVVATSTMPREDWIKARNFSYMTAFLHFDKVLQMPNIILNSLYGISYKEIIDTFIENPERTPAIGEVNSIFSEQSNRLRQGGAEYIHSKEWLNIWWPADEYALIKTAVEGKFDEFYREAEVTLDGLLTRKGISDHKEVLSETLSFNKNLMKMPFQNEDLVVDTRHNVWDIYRAGLLSEKVPLIKRAHRHLIDRTSQKWTSWEDWCREVIWWDNKKGGYIYSASPIGIIPEIAIAKNGN